MSIEKIVQDEQVPENVDNQSYGFMERLRKGIEGSKTYQGLVTLLSGLALAYTVNTVDINNGRVVNTASAEQAEESVCQDEVTIDKYWKAAEPVNNPEYPEGTRMHEYGSQGICKRFHIQSITNNKYSGLGWKSEDNFREEIYNSPNQKKLVNLLKNYNVDVDKFKNLLESCSHKIGVGFYDTGKCVVLDNINEKSYVFPTKQGISTAIAKEVYGLQ